jgi:hypothetical protein
MQDYKERSKLQYIATQVFNSAFWSYTLAYDPVSRTNVGTLAVVPTANAANCPAGRILRFNGKKLYPGGAYPGITTMLVGVYDPQSQLSGFIDPNSPLFAVFNSDKPVEVVDGSDLSGGVPHLGPSVYTAGNIVAAGQIRSTGFTALVASSSPIVINAAVAPLFAYACATGVTAQTIRASPVPPAGTMVQFIIYPSSVSCTITFDSAAGFRSTGTLATGTGGVTTRFVITFISDSVYLCEMSRTAVQS